MVKFFTRRHSYIILTISLLIVYVLARSVSWSGSPLTHALLEMSSAIFALVIGAMALVNYHSQANPKYLIIGYGFIALSILDGYFAINTSSWLSSSETALLLPWTWFSSKLSLAILLIMSCVLCSVSNKQSRQMSSKTVIPITLAFLITLIIILQKAPLPDINHANFPTRMLWTLLPICLFILVLIN